MDARREGVAHSLWLRIEELRLARGMTKDDLHKASGVAKTTIDDLRSRTRAPHVRTVHALADAVGLDRTEATRLAGLLPARPDPGISVRDAIAASADYTPEQKRALLAIVDEFDAGNRNGRVPQPRSGESRSTRRAV